MSTNHETLPLKRARRPQIDDYVTPERYHSMSLGDIETIVLVGTITILALCIVGSFIFLIRSMVPPV